MAENSPNVPPPSAEHRRIAAAQYERANQVITTGNYDYGIRLLLSCCKLDPANLIYRQALRRTEKTKYQNNLRGSRLAGLTSVGTKAKLKAAKRTGDYLKVLEHGESILTGNPWDVGTQMDMAEAADALGLLDLAVWILEQARQKNPRDAVTNRALARLYEKRGNFTQAIGLWEMVRKADPRDVEAQNKAKDLAANETIARGRYEEAVSSNPDEAAEDTGEPAPSSPLEKGSTTHPVLAGRVVSGPIAAGGPPAPVDRAAREAAPLLEKIKNDPTNANTYLHLAAVYRRADQFDQAREVLQQGIGPTGNNFEITAELADLEIEPFRRNLAVAEEKLKSDPQHENLRKLRIRLLKEINTRELELFRQKADRYPTEMAHRFELGVRLLRAGQLDEAIQTLQQARNDPKNHWRALLYLGYCFRNRNNWRLAQRNFEEALQQVPANEAAARKEIMFQLAQGNAEAGDLPRAIDLGTELANLDFGYRDIGRLLDDWQKRLEQAKVPK
jgi:tetratricopeptide (TPR) repeat protein